MFIFPIRWPTSVVFRPLLNRTDLRPTDSVSQTSVTGGGLQVCLTSADLLGPMLPQLVLRPPGKKIQEAAEPPEPAETPGFWLFGESET